MNKYEKFYNAFINHLIDLIEDFKNHNDNSYNKGVKDTLEHILNDFNSMKDIYIEKDI